MKIKELDFIPGFKKKVMLAPYTTWNIGGPATYFWEPNVEQLPKVLEYAHKNAIPVWFLGRGSNVLIDSKGLDGIVICTRKSLQEINLKDDVITAEAGVPMPKLSKFAAGLGWGGYEYLIGIPGTVGAGIAINAGLTANGRKEIGDVLIDVELMDMKGNRWWESKERLALGYRASNIPERRLFILRARFKATYHDEIEEIKHKTATHLAERRRKQPLSKPTAGSTFKQPEGGKPAGWYIDRAGMKGFQIGDAKVSEKHANWIENDGNATSNDVLQLMQVIKNKVASEFSVYLESEVVALN
ncbi:UDP-N-acetylmuramate dehydrogenase [Balneolaceae bacterium ANBcel3]|nr:UDP-N-acetylmuramate dehydrogenase [Balneolaceae bacterium ANBcel3]